ncbi:helix-turn-helix domain-containing protein [Streptomyces sp. NBC_00648]|uniref:helix-turn-helix domain-containing protein n=1 Tax=Streptomyces sp. NBC_00648 TaxID=2975797 RepID=UPI003248F4B5
MGRSAVTADTMVSADGSGWFCEMVPSELTPAPLSTQRTSDVHARHTGLNLGPVRVSSVAFSRVCSRRAATPVRRDDPGSYQLALATQGAFNIARLRNASVVAGGLVLTDTSRPMENICFSDYGAVEAIVLQIPRTVLPLRSDRVDRILAQPGPVHAGAGGGTAKILADFLRSLHHHGPRCGPDELLRLGSVALDLATACLAQRLEAQARDETPVQTPAEAHAQAMLQRVLQFIDDNLDDRELTPQAVADRHNMSLRGLYTLFRDQPVSVAETIRRRRLARCHAELACPESSRRTVEAIAARWGFASATAFGRAFRNAYGITPGEHRAAARSLSTAPSVQEPCTPDVDRDRPGRERRGGSKRHPHHRDPAAPPTK